MCGGSECCFFCQFCVLLVVIRISEKKMNERYFERDSDSRGPITRDEITLQ